MLKFTREQMEQFAGASEQMLRVVIGNLARTESPYVLQGLPSDLFDEIIDSGITTARSYGLQSPKDLSTFVLLQFEIGPEFHRYPVIHAVLADPIIAPERKLEVMYERTPPEVWQNITSLLHKQTWFPELREESAP